MKNIFEKSVTDEVIERINQLKPDSQPVWGKMNVAQMLAHCSVAYQMVYDEAKYPKPNGFAQFLLKTFVKKMIVGEKPYGKNGRTSSAFLIVDEREFNTEKTKLIDFLNKTQGLGEAHFHNKASHSLGILSSTEWNGMFYKHLDHHLSQFGV